MAVTVAVEIIPKIPNAVPKAPRAAKIFEST